MLENLFGVFQILKDKEKFNEVFIDEYGNIAWDIDKKIDSSIHWNNRIDLCKDSVYIESIHRKFSKHRKGTNHTPTFVEKTSHR